MKVPRNLELPNRVTALLDKTPRIILRSATWAAFLARAWR